MGIDRLDQDVPLMHVAPQPLTTRAGNGKLQAGWTVFIF
jgi:hypothetical protein